MPVYEFYCSDCHMVFNFLARRVNTDKRPACPKCAKPELERRVSRFAISKGRQESDEDPMPDLDESRMEQAMEALAREAGGIDEDDPRQVAGLMRKLSETTGMNLGPGMEEAMRRMEAGEDPDKIEEEMGDLMEEEPFSPEGAKKPFRRLKSQLLPPQVDPTLYEL